LKATGRKEKEDEYQKDPQNRGNGCRGNRSRGLKRGCLVAAWHCWNRILVLQKEMAKKVKNKSPQFEVILIF